MEYFKPEFRLVIIDSELVCTSSGGLINDEDFELKDSGDMDDLL